MVKQRGIIAELPCSTMPKMQSRETFNVHLPSLSPLSGSYFTKHRQEDNKKCRYRTKEARALVKFGSIKASLALVSLTDSDACCVSGVRQEIDQHRFFSRHSFKLHETSDCRFTFGKNFARDLKSVFGSIEI